MNKQQDQIQDIGKLGSTQNWVVVVGAISGIITLLFFMSLVVLSILGHRLPQNDRYLAIIVLSLGISFSTSFLGGSAAAKGEIPVPFVKNNPISFSVFGGIAVFVISLLVGNYLYIDHSGNDEITTAMELKKEFELNNNFQQILANIQSCKPSYKSYGGTIGYIEMNKYIDFLDRLGFLYKENKISSKTIKDIFKEIVIASYVSPELKKYINGIRENAGQPYAASNFYDLANTLLSNEDKLVEVLSKCEKI